MNENNLKYDFLPRIYAHEEEILNSWKRHFDSIGVPYKITDHVEKGAVARPYKTLWKEKRV